MSESPFLSISIRKIVVYNRPFSFLLYSVIPNKKNPVTCLFRRSIFGVISSVLRSVFEVFISYVMFTTLFGVYKQHVAAENLFLVIIYGSGNVLAAIHEFHGALNQKQIAEIINEIQSIDDKLINLNIIPNNNQVVRIAGGWAIGSGILWIILAATHELIFSDVILLWIGFVFPYFLMYISTFHFIGIVLLISQRFELLNDNFRDISTYVNSLNEFTETLGIAGCDVIWETDYRLEVLRNLRQAIVKVAEKLEGAYSVQLLMTFLTYFAIFVQKFHRIVIANDTSLTLANTFYVTSWLLTISFTFFSICWACTTCHRHARKTAKIIPIAKPDVRNKYLTIFSKQFSMELTHAEVNFTVCGLFVIDMSLLLEMTTTIASYIIICLQFSWSK